MAEKRPAASGGRRPAWLAIGLLLIPLPALAETPVSIGMKLLVVAVDGNEPSFAAIKSMLNQIGVPYDTLIATQTALSAQTLSDGAGKGRYQGILLTSGDLSYQTQSEGTCTINRRGRKSCSGGGSVTVSAFSATQWQILRQYEATFRVRQATLFTNPSSSIDNYGLSPVTVTNAVVQGNLTSAGKQVFSYLNPSVTIPFMNTATYLAVTQSSLNPVPLLTTSQGYPLVSVYTYTDGRQNLALTADNNPYLLHSQLLGYGIINWVSKGVFLGERKSYLSAQVDDVLIADDIWDPQARSDQSGKTFRMNGVDYTQLMNWQSALNVSHPNASRVRLEMAYNGVGATSTDTTLTTAIKAAPGPFNWLSHTYSHASLNSISYGDALYQLQQNDTVALTLGLRPYTKDSLVQPDVSGLNNPEFLRAGKDYGLKYILSDTSVAGGDNPSPNTGRYSPYQPGILVIPRHPTNLYYNVSTPQEWTSEYNYFYAPGGLWPYWDHALSYAELLDKESEILIRYLLKGDVDPLMFHQPNLRAYDGTHSLLGDLINTTMTKYNAMFNLPVLSPSQHDVGGLMAERMAYDASGVTGTIVLGNPTQIRLQTSLPVTAPVTGLDYGTAKEVYGGQTISRVTLAGNGALTVPAPTW